MRNTLIPGNHLGVIYDIDQPYIRTLSHLVCTAVETRSKLAVEELNLFGCGDTSAHSIGCMRPNHAQSRLHHPTIRAHKLLSEGSFRDPFGKLADTPLKNLTLGNAKDAEQFLRGCKGGIHANLTQQTTYTPDAKADVSEGGAVQPGVKWELRNAEIILARIIDVAEQSQRERVGRMSCSNQFSTGYALPLSVDRVALPQNGRGKHAECPCCGRAEALKPGHGHVRDSDVSSPHPRLRPVLNQSAILACPQHRPCAQSVRVPGRGQATNCPHPRNVHGQSANCPRPQTGSDLTWDLDGTRPVSGLHQVSNSPRSQHHFSPGEPTYVLI